MRNDIIFPKHTAFLLTVAAALFVLPLAPKSALAGPIAKKSPAEITRKECGACHYPYARNWLPAYSWKKIMNNLGDHFGENAMLDDQARKEITSYLIGNRSADIPIRVTDTKWWLRVHGGESIKDYARKKGFEAYNCEKCHR